MIERRAVHGLEIRQTQGGRPRLSGYAAVFNSPSLELAPGFVEIIRAGAFTRSLRDEPDVRAYVDHDSGRIIGRQKNDTLRVTEDRHGLRVDIEPGNTTAGRDVLEDVRTGTLDAMSFAFSLFDPQSGQRWNFASDPPLRELLEVRLYEVSIVAMPAYPDTTIAARAMTEASHRTRPRSVAELEAKLRARESSWRRS